MLQNVSRQAQVACFLAQVLQQTLALFERCWGVADQLDVTMDEQTTATIYCTLFAKIVEAAGIVITADIVPPEGNVARLMQAVFP